MHNCGSGAQWSSQDNVQEIWSSINPGVSQSDFCPSSSTGSTSWFFIHAFVTVISLALQTVKVKRFVWCFKKSWYFGYFLCFAGTYSDELGVVKYCHLLARQENPTSVICPVSVLVFLSFSKEFACFIKLERDSYWLPCCSPWIWFSYCFVIFTTYNYSAIYHRVTLRFAGL